MLSESEHFSQKTVRKLDEQQMALLDGGGVSDLKPLLQ